MQLCLRRVLRRLYNIPILQLGLLTCNGLSEVQHRDPRRCFGIAHRCFASYFRYFSSYCRLQVPDGEGRRSTSVDAIVGSQRRRHCARHRSDSRRHRRWLIRSPQPADQHIFKFDNCGWSPDRWSRRRESSRPGVHRVPVGLLQVAALRQWLHCFMGSTVASSRASHIPAVRSDLPLSSWNSPVVPRWEPSRSGHLT